MNTIWFGIIELLKQAKNAAIPAKYVLFDSWFSSPSSIHAVKEIGYDVIAMVKKTPKMFFRYQGEDMSLISIYNKNKKRRGRSRYLLSVMVDVVKDGKSIPAKVVYVRNRNKRKEYLCIMPCYYRDMPQLFTGLEKIDALFLTVSPMDRHGYFSTGIGAVPEAVGLALKDKHDLGIHTELFTDSMVELIQCGAVTNNRKPVYKGKSVATLAFGSQRIYDYINDNPAFLLLPVNEVNDPAVIAQHPDFISVNAALEVDFFGQVCAESMGTLHMSGTGGQADYVRGATQSNGGKSFIAFPSTAKGGTISRIKSVLTPGSIVTTSKNDVDYIVTEYGMAKLRGCTLSQRIKGIISVAHPKFREKLIFEAKKRNILI